MKITDPTCVFTDANPSANANRLTKTKTLLVLTKTKTLLALCGVLCLLAASAAEARADEVTVAGSTSGLFTSPGPAGASTGASLMGLQFVGSTFNRTTSGGAAQLDGAAAHPAVAGSANLNNLGSFYLQPPPDLTLDSYNGATFTLTVTFDAPLALTGGQQATFSATLTGQVVNTALLDSYGVRIDFDNTPRLFTYTLADGRTGSFEFVVQDITSITPNFPRALAGEIRAAAQDPSEVPEPASMLLLGSGLAGAYVARRRRRRVPGACAQVTRAGDPSRG